MENIKITNNKMLISTVVSLIGVLILIIAMFLPYMTAVGQMADYIEAFPDVVVIEEQNVTIKDLEKVPFISVSKLVESIWGEDDAQIVDIFLIVFGSFTVLTTIFIFFKKPILTMICDIFTCGTFILLSVLLKEDLIGADKYTWGVGLLLILIAVAVILIGSVWMLVSKIIQKKRTHKNNRLDDTNNRVQTDGIVDAINNK